MIDRLTASLESFLNSCISEDNQEHAAWVADKIPGVDLVVLCCKTIPYYWPHTTRLEKVGIILAISLMVASIALIAIGMVSAALPILPTVATLLAVVGIFSKYGKDLYKHVIAKSEARYKRLEQTKELSKQLDKQLQLVEERIEELFPNRNVDWNTVKSTPKPQLIRPYHIKHVQEGFALLYDAAPNKNAFKHWER